MTRTIHLTNTLTRRKEPLTLIDPASKHIGIYGCGVTVVLYVLANLAYVAVLPFPEIQHAPQNRVAVAMMNAALTSK